jgi:hypothetical protein
MKSVAGVVVWKVALQIRGNNSDLDGAVRYLS